ncbi:MAG: cyclic beta 1-2 glucan synthetase, partial [Longimicrobiales bacterium]
MQARIQRLKNSRLGGLFGIPKDRTPAQLAGPIRGELFGAERLGAFARRLGERQVLLPRDHRRGAGPLLNRLEETSDILEQARAVLAEAAARDLDISPAGVWLLDNFFVVEDHIRDIRANLPAHYYRELPKLANGLLAGYPRVYEIAIELIAHSEGHVSQDNIDLFVREFQSASTLSMGELWAIPSMLRLSLLENIRRMSLRAVDRLEEVESAAAWADRLRAAATESDRELGQELSQFVHKHPRLSPAFISQFIHQIRRHETDFTPMLWIEEWIAEDGLSIADAVSRDNQRIALTQLMMANSITSLRALTLIDWKVFFETQSAVEGVLREDPSGDYAGMTFETRDRYRHVIERLAKRTRQAETDVAAGAVALANEARADGGAVTSREQHVGYWIVDDGRPQLEDRIGYARSWSERVHRIVTRHPSTVYFGGILLVTLALLTLLYGAVAPVTVPGSLFVLLFLALPANEIAVGIVNQIITQCM